ncbi:hypothetical protein ACWGH2_20835 [Streptomyces sp. NPDC054871]
MERTIEEARRVRADRLTSDESGISVQPGTNITIFYSVCFAVPLVVAIVCLILGSQQLLPVALIAGLAAVIAVRPLVVIVAGGIGNKALMGRVRKALGDGLPERAHAVRFGLHAQNTPGASPWDTAPVKEGAIAVTGDGLHLLSAVDSAVLPLTDVLGVVLLPGRGFSPDRFDIHLRSGGAIEVSTTGSRALGADMSRAGVRVLQEL